jgi:hypothetical protein
MTRDDSSLSSQELALYTYSESKLVNKHATLSLQRRGTAWTVGVRFPSKERDVSLVLSIQTTSGAHPTWELGMFPPIGGGEEATEEGSWQCYYKPIPCVFMIQFNSVVPSTPRFPKWLLPFRFCIKSPSLPRVLHSPSFSFSLINHLWRGMQIMGHTIM